MLDRLLRRRGLGYDMADADFGEIGTRGYLLERLESRKVFLAWTVVGSNIVTFWRDVIHGEMTRG